MGLLDFLTSTKKPAADTPVLPEAEVRQRLAGLNRPAAPWRIVDGKSESVDYIAEWKIVDAEWKETFGKAGMSKVFRIYLKLDPGAHLVRAMDREYEVAWSRGVSGLAVSLSASVSGFKGQKQEISFGKAVAFTETAGPQEVYEYRFQTSEIKKPIQDAVTGCGWTYKGVAFGKL